MKLNYGEAIKLLKALDMSEDWQLANVLGVSLTVIELYKRGIRVGYEIARDFYNMYGEGAFERIFDLEEDTVEGFKAKYIPYCGGLY